MLFFWNYAKLIFPPSCWLTIQLAHIFISVSDRFSQAQHFFTIKAQFWVSNPDSKHTHTHIHIHFCMYVCIPCMLYGHAIDGVGFEFYYYDSQQGLGFEPRTRVSASASVFL